MAYPTLYGLFGVMPATLSPQLAAAIAAGLASSAPTLAVGLGGAALVAALWLRRVA